LGLQRVATFFESEEVVVKARPERTVIVCGCRGLRPKLGTGICLRSYKDAPSDLSPFFASPSMLVVGRGVVCGEGW